MWPGDGGRCSPPKASVCAPGADTRYKMPAEANAYSQTARLMRAGTGVNPHLATPRVSEQAAPVRCVRTDAFPLRALSRHGGRHPHARAADALMRLPRTCAARLTTGSVGLTPMNRSDSCDHNEHVASNKRKSSVRTKRIPAGFTGWLTVSAGHRARDAAGTGRFRYTQLVSVV